MLKVVSMHCLLCREATTATGRPVSMPQRHEVCVCVCVGGEGGAWGGGVPCIQISSPVEPLIEMKSPSRISTPLIRATLAFSSTCVQLSTPRRRMSRMLEATCRKQHGTAETRTQGMDHLGRARATLWLNWMALHALSLGVCVMLFVHTCRSEQPVTQGLPQPLATTAA